MGCCCENCAQNSPRTLYDLEERGFIKRHPQIKALIINICSLWIAELIKFASSSETLPNYLSLEPNKKWSAQFDVPDHYPPHFCKGDVFHTVIWILGYELAIPLKELSNEIKWDDRGYHEQSTSIMCFESSPPTYRFFSLFLLSRYISKEKLHSVLMKKIIQMGSTYMDVSSKDWKQSTPPLPSISADTSMESKLTGEVILWAQERKLDVCQYEWGISHEGKGDLVFTNRKDVYLIVEVKYVDLTTTGVTSRRRRTKHRKYVKEQALKYADLFRLQLIKDQVSFLAVIPCVYTNEVKLKIVYPMVSIEDLL